MALFRRLQTRHPTRHPTRHQTRLPTRHQTRLQTRLLLFSPSHNPTRLKTRALPETKPRRPISATTITLIKNTTHISICHSFLDSREYIYPNTRGQQPFHSQFIIHSKYSTQYIIKQYCVE